MAPSQTLQSQRTKMSPEMPKKLKLITNPEHPKADKLSSKVLKLLETVRTDECLLKDAAELVKDAAVSVGLLIRHPDLPDALKPVPVTLFPTILSSEALREITQIQCDINLLMHRVAHDREFLVGALSGAASVDPFIRNLLSIYAQIALSKQWEFCLFRSDYILHNPGSGREDSSDFEETLRSTRFKQVEVNTICVGLAGLGSKIWPVHDRLLKFLDPAYQSQESSDGETLALYGNALSMAQSVYANCFLSPRPKLVLIAVHKVFEFNIMDQRFVEFQSGVRALRRTFQQIRESAYVDEAGTLFVEGFEIAVVYFRTGYSPGQYDGQQDWDLRLLMETSNAIKCPSVAYQLAGFKKIQQELSLPHVLRRYVSSEDVCRRLLNVNVGQWDLSDPESSIAISKALANPAKYVLKPNREGGGNNFYFQDLVDKIHQARNTPQAQDYVLMEKIEPPFQENYLIRAQMDPSLVKSISEIGVFGAIIARNDDVVFNMSAEEVLVRSKCSTTNEGGVATGFSCISSVWKI